MVTRRYGAYRAIVETSSPDPRVRQPVHVVTIEIWSDVVCPWCYIGKRQFEAGLDLLADEDLGVDFDVTYRPFQLDPTAAPRRRPNP